VRRILVSGFRSCARHQLDSEPLAAVVLSLPIIRFRNVPKRRLHERAHVLAIQQFLAQGIHLTERRIGEC